MKATRLTFKQKRFAEEYVKNNGNGTQAALKVYDTTKYQTAQAIASENLLKPEVKETIDQIAEKMGITSSLILDNFKDLAVREVEKVSADAKLKANIEMAKILGLYPGSKHSRLNVTIKGTVKDMSHSEVKEELKVIDNELNELLEEPSNPTG